MENKLQKKYYDELNIFRALIIVWVAIGHSINFELNFIGFFYSYAYSFHMIAFFVLSGFLFESKIKRSREGIKIALSNIADRAKRLLVPYTFFSIISVILKIFLDNYAYNKLGNNPLTVFTNIISGLSPNGGIWFLYALFLISALAILTCKVNSIIMLIITFGLRILLIFIPITINPVDLIFRYSFVFFLGVVIKENYEAISKSFERLFSKKNGTLILSAITIIAGVISIFAVYLAARNEISDIIKIALSLYNTVLWYLIAQLINRTKAAKKFAMIVGNYGMDIYMIGYYVQIPIRVVFITILGLPYVPCALMMFIFGLLLPIPISKYIVRKVKLFRALMLGDFSKKEMKKNG